MVLNLVTKSYTSCIVLWNYMHKCYYHYIGWTNDKNKSCRSSEVIQLCSWFFSISITFPKVKYVWIFEIWKFKISTGLKWRNIQNKIVEHEKLWNFVVHFIWNHIVNDFEWRNSHNESCRSQKVMKFCSWELLIWIHLKPEKAIYTRCSITWG
jgi:hypothetical protein